MADKLQHIELTGDGFRLMEDGLEVASVDWLHLQQIIAYRYDPQGKDLLCLGFRKSLESEYIEINEEMDGYSSLLEAIYQQFPSINPNWWQKVAGPMGTNRQTIYGMSLGEQAAPDAAKAYLNNIEKRKKTASFRKKILIAIIVLALLGVLCYLLI